MAKKPVLPDFNKIAENALKGLPEFVGEKARAHFLKSFIKEGFTDVSFIPWPKGKSNQTHKLLSQSLALKNSITVTQANMQMVKIMAGQGLPYAAIHNEGGILNIPITERSRKFFWMMFKKTNDEKWKYMAITKKERMTVRIPKRQFIGDSYALMQDIDKLFVDRILEAQKNLKF